MTLDHAISILGINRTRDNDLRPMVKALQMHEWLNTEEDNVRLAAARHVLRNWSAYTAECDRRRRGKRTGFEKALDRHHRSQHPSTHP